MAFPADNGDISRIIELGRYNIPGAGHNNIGQAVNNKVIVWGRLTGLYASTGLDLLRHGGTDAAFGLSNTDKISLTCRKAGAAGAILPTSDNGYLANVTRLLGKIFLVDQCGQANPTVPEAGDTVVIDYVAIGDELAAPELV
ncbi:hypothetical protein LCGC14_0208830 [marine sediment metagenome]|uniref:Uncharacterized protein n=1 Tax=marine sediment metagenome TaxID=412755 RepID=A0A0F9UY14_9ZZZZ